MFERNPLPIEGGTLVRVDCNVRFSPSPVQLAQLPSSTHADNPPFSSSSYGIHLRQSPLYVIDQGLRLRSSRGQRLIDLLNNLGWCFGPATGLKVSVGAAFSQPFVWDLWFTSLVLFPYRTQSGFHDRNRLIHACDYKDALDFSSKTGPFGAAKKTTKWADISSTSTF